MFKLMLTPHDREKKVNTHLIVPLPCQKQCVVTYYLQMFNFNY